MNHPPAPPVASHEPAAVYYLRRALEWIDALPQDLALPAMPGFDRDEANAALAAPVVAPAEPMPEQPDSFHFGSPVPSEDLQAALSDENQWFGDMMILQVLADSDQVNEQEREVLHRWIAASARPGSGWQPIETAPKDGTEILAWREDCGPFMAKWSSAEELRTMTDKERDELDEESRWQEDWFGGDSEMGGFRCDGGEAPTHWMPLPPAPDNKDMK